MIKISIIQLQMIKVIVITLLLATALSKYEDDRINKQNPIPVHFVITHRGTQPITPTLFTQATCQSSRTLEKFITCSWNQTVDQTTTILWPCGLTEVLAAHHFSVIIDSKNFRIFAGNWSILSWRRRQLQTRRQLDWEQERLDQDF